MVVPIILIIRKQELRAETFAELDMSIKNRISHRGKAVTKAKTLLKKLINQ